MRRWAVAAAVLATPAMAMAQQAPEHWVYVGMKGGAMGWDTSGIERDSKSGVTKVTRFIYAREPMRIPGGEFTFLMQEMAINCLAKTFQLGDSLYMDKNLAPVGDGAAETEWRKLVDKTPEGLLADVVCNGVQVTSTESRDVAEDAMTASMKLALP